MLPVHEFVAEFPEQFYNEEMKRAKKISDWLCVDVQERVDSFNFEEFKAQLESETQGGNAQIALNLEETRFLSLPSIKYVSQLAEDLNEKGGKLAIVATPERLKRQIEIYASMEGIQIYRHAKDLGATQLYSVG